MKQYLLADLLLGTLAGCGGPGAATDADPTHAAVAAYLQKNLDDPASYQPARWGKQIPLTRQDSANLAALRLMKSNIRQQREIGYKLMERHPADSLKELGVSVVHAFRAKNKLGAIVLDSAQFGVYKNGQVPPL